MLDVLVLLLGEHHAQYSEPFPLVLGVPVGCVVDAAGEIMLRIMINLSLSC